MTAAALTTEDFVVPTLRPNEWRDPEAKTPADEARARLAQVEADKELVRLADEVAQAHDAQNAERAAAALAALPGALKAYDALLVELEASLEATALLVAKTITARATYLQIFGTLDKHDCIPAGHTRRVPLAAGDISRAITNGLFRC